jgi:hypothetical protein
MREAPGSIPAPKKKRQKKSITFIIKKNKPGMVVHTYNPITWRRQEDHQFTASLGYTARPCLKKKKKKQKKKNFLQSF